MRRVTMILLAVLPLFLVAIMLGQPQAHAQNVSKASYRSFTGSISASNAAVTSDIASSDMLVVRSMQVASSQAGTLVFTDGASGVALLQIYVAANTPRLLSTADIGNSGIRCTRGNELYLNALASATVSVSMATTLE